MKKNFQTQYLANDIAVFQKVKGGFRALWDDEGTYQWGEFIADADFIEDAFQSVEYVATNFSETSPSYQRQMTEQVMQLVEKCDA